MLQRFISRFCVEIFFVSVLKNFVGEPFWSVYQKKSGIENEKWIRGGGKFYAVSRFSVKKCLSHSAEKFRRGTFLICVSKMSRYKSLKHLARQRLEPQGLLEGPSTGIFFSRKQVFWSHSPKHFVGIPSVFQKIWGIEKFYA